MVPPVVGDPKLTPAVAPPLHTTWLLTGFTVAVGLTVMVKLLGVPTQVIPPLVKLGVTVMVPVMGALLELVAEKVVMFPVPLAARPIALLLLDQA